MAWTTLCELDEVTNGRGKYVEIDGFRLAVWRDGERVAVTDDVCPHAGVSLSAGTIEGNCCVCPRHNWAFDLDTGAIRATGAVALTVYVSRLFTRDDGTAFVQAELPQY